MTRPHISVVVCTFNRSDLLPQALGSLQKQQGLRGTYEIVVVDNASTDNTKSVLMNLREHCGFEFSYEYEPNPGVAHARNRGIERSRGDWIAFFDDDQVADVNWLSELLQEADRRGVQSVGGSVLLKLPAQQPEEPVGTTRRMLGEDVLATESQPYGRRHAPGAGNWMIHRDVFNRVGTFDPSLEYGGEDTDLYRRIRNKGFQSWYTPAAVVHHLIPVGRLSRDHLRRTAIRIGGHVARRECLQYSRIGLLVMMSVRFMQAYLIFAPRMHWHRFRGEDQHALAQECGFWRCRGYCHWGLATLGIHWFSTSGNCESMTFRGDRVPSGDAMETVRS